MSVLQIYLAALFSLTLCTTASRPRFDRRPHCSRDPEMPRTVFTAERPCDSSVNCRHGGICWRGEDNVEEPEICKCTMHCVDHPARSTIDPELDYVCGSDGVTYETECHLRLAACRCQETKIVQWSGSCEKGPRAPPRDLPGIPRRRGSQDGSGDEDSIRDLIRCVEGKTCLYGAVCDVDSEDGPCLCKHDCDGSSSYTVCGTDGRSYFNQCYLKEAACQDQKKVQLDYVGPCISDGSNYPMPGPGVLDRGFYGSGLADTYDDTETPVISNNPCASIYCLHGACVPIGRDDFECSCDAVCNEDAFALQQNTLARFGKSSIEEMYKIMPEFQSRLFDYEQENDLDVDQSTTTVTTTTEAQPKRRRRPPKPGKKRDFWSKGQEQYDVNVINADKDFFKGIDNPDTEWMRTNRRGRLRRRNRKRKGSKKRGNRLHKRSALFSPPRRMNLQTDVVCGSDGKTYKDECQMRIHACYEKKYIKVRKVGYCPKPTRFRSTPSTHTIKANPTTKDITKTSTTTRSSTTTTIKTTTTTTTRTTPVSDISTTTSERTTTGRPSTTVQTKTAQIKYLPSKDALRIKGLSDAVVLEPANLVQSSSRANDSKTTKTTLAPTTNMLRISGQTDGNKILDSLRKPWVIVLGAVLQVTLMALVGSFLYRRFVKRLQNNKQNNNEEKTPSNQEESVALN